MKKNAQNAMATATELLAERRKFEGWLEALNSRRSTTPEHVFTRVHADYAARLEAVVSELRNKSDALDARVAELTARVASLQDDARLVRDERAETELRAHVGELEAGAWEAAAREADARLESLGEERRTVEQELASIREVIGAARSPTPAMSAAAVAPGKPAAQPEPEPSVGESMEAPAAHVRTEQQDAFAQLPDGTDVTEQSGGAGNPEESAGGDAPLMSEPPNPRPAGGFDELAFLRDVTGEEPASAKRAEEPGRVAPEKRAERAPEPATAEPAVSAESAAPAAFSSSPTKRPAEPAARRSGERPINDSLGLVLRDDTPALTPPRRPSTETPMAANVSGNAPIILQSEMRQVKTLKCTDCGSMNYPTEWYCERCGAELSAL